MSIIDSALSQIRQLQPYSPGKPVEELERELGIGNAIKLASNENPLGCSPLAREALQQAGEQIRLYPDANAFYLKRRLGEKLGVGVNQITIGNGSNDVLDLIARSFLERGTESVFSEYAFMVYAMVTRACGADGKPATALGADSEMPYGHDLKAMRALVSDRTRVVFIANPNNPTGTWLDADSLLKFIDSIPAHIAVVVDEAYFEYVDIDGYPDCLQWLDRFPNLIVTRTFSKIHGLAGLRLGYAVSSAELCELFNRVRQPFNGNSVALAAACAALDDEAFVLRSRESNRRGLELMQAWFDENEVACIPSVGNFVTAKFGADSTRIYQELLERGLIVRPVANYGLQDYLRISVGTEAQLARLFAALGELR